MYPEGMLDRDQRTTKLLVRRDRLSDKEVPKNNSFINSNVNAISNFNSIISIVIRRKYSTVSHTFWKKGYLIHRFQRLKNVLLVLVYLTLITILPTLRAASISMEQPKWVNHCDSKKPENCSADVADFGGKIKVDDLLDRCVKQINLAKDNATEYIRNFTDFEAYNTMPKFEWLPEIGKNINEDIPTHILEKLTLEHTLLEIHENLQKIAVGLEQVARDQKGKQPNFKVQENQNRYVLCEIEDTLNQLKLCFHPEIDSNIMTDRGGDETKKTKDMMIIFREYINNLEYAKMALNHLKESPRVKNMK